MRQKDLRPAPALIEYKGMKFLITDRPSDITINHYIMELKKNHVNTVVRVCEPSYNTDELEAQGITVKDLAFDDGTFPPQQVVDEWFEVLKDNFRKSTSATLSYYRHKRFSLRHIPKTAPMAARASLSAAASAATAAAAAATASNTTASSDTDTDTMPLTANETDTRYNNTAFVDNETCRYQQNPEACVAVHCVAGLGRAPVLVALALIELGLKYEAAVEMIRDKRRGAINAKQLSFLEKYKPKARLKHKNGHKNSCSVQ
ncbi:PREDICTED: protein tyrosine phosphatase type IVA 3 isoform X1 [Drosophila arizonae]|uniref:Protein tyrosine phosphatase type IVA 3 isoform X1 n=1 Tax=Drosophila arizonae TaxID=7263 RepID=A0ABM1NQY3_DROAR|nr:PREDICTED: protein tyrosine phosphatase type IVA 3 isoform X1 [Drosophila arizonae]